MFKNKSIERDEVFSRSLETVPEFKFDEKVTEVFEDMIKRSVPGYDLLIYMIGLYGTIFIEENTNVYDLGSSTGVATCIIAEVTKDKNINIVAVDNSKPMMIQCQKNLDAIGQLKRVACHVQDIQTTDITQSSFVVLNFTLQFIEPKYRMNVLKNIYDGLNKNGVLVLSEKVKFDNHQLNKSMIDIHQAFKKSQGYSELEISQKRTSIENLLIPDSIEEHIKRLKEIGFSQVFLCFQCLNFVSFLAIK